jgi:hypothetical protein
LTIDAFDARPFLVGATRERQDAPASTKANGAMNGLLARRSRPDEASQIDSWRQAPEN